MHRVRLWATSLLVAAYAFGALAPALAFSFDRDASIVHSLVEAHGGVLLLHIHHDDKDQPKSGQERPHVDHHCCGVFALQALSPLSATFSLDKPCRTLIRAEPQDHRPVCERSRLDRPPRITV